MREKEAWKKYSSEKKQQVMEFAETYRRFISDCKTERECVDEIKKQALQAGFEDMQEVIASGKKLQPGDRVFADNKGKSMALYIIGRQPMEQGLNILGAHIDSPRLDLKQNPLYEDTSLALLDTHYYGGVKKYQWVALPLALHGVVVRKDGTKAVVNIGEKPEDPVFGVSDLLIHLAGTQMEKKGAKVIEGEDLNVLVGSMPLENADKETKETVKANILALLSEYYQIEEEDFLSAEIEVVPAHKARDIGLDRAMIGAYGHDDRVDAYPALMAEIGITAPAYTTICVLTDKEETGSDGVTGLNSMYTFHFIQQLCAGQGADYITACKAGKCLSADVTAAYDPTFADAFEPDNATYAGNGVAIYKYTGARGKSGTSDACAEMVSYLTRLLEKNNVVWQIGEMGKLDLGGGGTVAKYVANQDIDTIDIGVPVLSMHAPFEVVSKADVYMAYLTFKAFCEDAE